MLTTLRRPPLTYLLAVTLTGAQLVAFVVSGTVSGISPGGSALMLILLLALAARSKITWALLILMNAIQLLAVFIALLPAARNDSAQVLWVHIVVMLVTGVALEAVLLSPAMRRFVLTPVRQDGDQCTQL
jgi:hypothetical protein